MKMLGEQNDGCFREGLGYRHDPGHRKTRNALAHSEHHKSPKKEKRIMEWVRVGQGKRRSFKEPPCIICHTQNSEVPYSGPPASTLAHPATLTHVMEASALAGHVSNPVLEQNSAY